MESSPGRETVQSASFAGVKRSASLLPPFDPSSSPPLPRPIKRVARDSCDAEVSLYPTPVPTSSTAILTSSPPRTARPQLARTQSMLSERAPLSAVPCVMLQESGKPITMGRSSASCDYQLSSNRLISRVHVKAMYKPAEHPFGRGTIEILCTGWNGIKLHCQGKTYELTKGKTFTSDIKDADVMIDVQDTRVLVQWPRLEKKDTASTHSDQTWEESSPVRHARSSVRPRSVTPTLMRNRPRLVSPISPSPAVQALSTAAPATPTRSAAGGVVVYEDEPSPTNNANTFIEVPQTTTQLTSDPSDDNIRNILSSSTQSDELSEHDEENDPIVHSFGPFGENLLPRMASFNAGASPSPSRTPRAKTHKPAQSPVQAIPRKRPLEDARRETVQNHVINQLAFSRLSSTPFSTIINNLPGDLVLKTSNPNGFAAHEIRVMIQESRCIGEVPRQGKDAAGKPLESEYYYVPDYDMDEHRREAVVNGMGKRGLRNCRKQHKQYFWRKPKTP